MGRPTELARQNEVLLGGCPPAYRGLRPGRSLLNEAVNSRPQPRAADLLAERGWTRGGFREQGPICADRATALGSGMADTDPWPEEGGPYLGTLSAGETLLGRGSLMAGEMEPGRTAEHVITREQPLAELSCRHRMEEARS